MLRIMIFCLSLRDAFTSLLALSVVDAFIDELKDLSEKQTHGFTNQASKITLGNENAAIASTASAHSLNGFMDELFGVSWKSDVSKNSTDGNNVPDIPTVSNLPPINNKDNDIDMIHLERDLSSKDIIEKKVMLGFSVFSNAMPITIPGEVNENGAIVYGGSLFDRDGYITGTSDTVCTYVLARESESETTQNRESICDIAFLFVNKYGLEVGQLYMQGLMSGTSSSEIYSITGGTGCFSGATGIGTIDKLPIGSLWYTQTHDIYLYEYWQHEHGGFEDTYPF
mmetsp:Transcript_38408/g.46347  ORF Transcript_38408/g.46347 Transcript_38408/m.46347 type:complete len:283 (+) Transcript_38408:17-865(+)